MEPGSGMGEGFGIHIFRERSELHGCYLRSSYWLGLEIEHPDIHPQIRQLRLQEMPPPGKHHLIQVSYMYQILKWNSSRVFDCHSFTLGCDRWHHYLWKVQLPCQDFIRQFLQEHSSSHWYSSSTIGHHLPVLLWPQCRISVAPYSLYWPKEQSKISQSNWLYGPEVEWCLNLLYCFGNL